MRGRNLQDSGAEGGIDLEVSDNWDPGPRKWTPTVFANEMLVARIFRIHRNSGIPHQGLRTRSRNLKKGPWLFDDFISHIIQSPVCRPGNHFFIGEGSLIEGIPVHHALASVDQSLAI